MISIYKEDRSTVNLQLDLDEKALHQSQLDRDYYTTLKKTPQAVKSSFWNNHQKEEKFQNIIKQTNIADSIMTPQNQSINLENIRIDQSMIESVQFYDQNSVYTSNAMNNLENNPNYVTSY